MEKARFFYDSYAVLGYLSGKPKFRVYFEETDGALTKLNLVEICSRILQVHGETAAAEVAGLLGKYVVDFGSEDIVASMKCKSTLKKDGRNLSFADALGYYLSLKHKLRFLTGDDKFEGLDGVEFVK